MFFAYRKSKTLPLTVSDVEHSVGLNRLSAPTRLGNERVTTNSWNRLPTAMTLLVRGVHLAMPPRYDASLRSTALPALTVGRSAAGIRLSIQARAFAPA